MLLIPPADAWHFRLHMLPRIDKGVQVTALKQSKVKWASSAKNIHHGTDWKMTMLNWAITLLTLMIFDDAQWLKLLGAFAPSLQEMQTAFHSSAKIQSRKESQTCWQALCQASHRASFRAAQVDSHLEAVPLDGRRVYMTLIWLQYPPKLNHKHPETHIENLCILQNHKQFKLFKHAPIPPSGQAPCQHLLHMETPWGRSVAQLPCLQ